MKKNRIFPTEKIRKIKFDTNASTWLEGEGEQKGVGLGDHRFTCEAYVFKGVNDADNLSGSLQPIFHKLLYRGIDISDVVNIQRKGSESDIIDVLMGLCEDHRDYFFNKYHSEAVADEDIIINNATAGYKYGIDLDICLLIEFKKYSIRKRENHRGDYEWKEIQTISINGIEIPPDHEDYYEALNLGLWFIGQDENTGVGSSLESNLVDFYNTAGIFKTNKNKVKTKPTTLKPASK